MKLAEFDPMVFFVALYTAGVYFVALEDVLEMIVWPTSDDSLGVVVS